MFKVIFIAGVIFGGCLFSVLAKTDSLTLYTEHFPPYNFKQNNDIVGINTELVQAMCLQAAIQCQFKLYPWLRAYENALRNRHSALFSTSRIPQREADFQWVGPLMYSTAYL